VTGPAEPKSSRARLRIGCLAGTSAQLRRTHLSGQLVRTIGWSCLTVPGEGRFSEAGRFSPMDDQRQTTCQAGETGQLSGAPQAVQAVIGGQTGA
jgi:hypothetical protein